MIPDQSPQTLQKLDAAMQSVMTLWAMGLVTASAVQRWADAAAVACAHPPDALLALALDGPAVCTKRSSADFAPQPLDVPFAQAFAWRAVALDVSDPAPCLAFVHWASRAAMGEDLAQPEVALGYALDQALDEAGEAAALAVLRAELPALRATQVAWCAPVWQGGWCVAGLAL